ncbi:MAG: anhydro-N-acetylmuramic acid kinase, partial [Pseudomonadota bacterium]
FKNGIGLDGPTEEPWLSIATDLSALALGIHGQTVSHRPDDAFTLQIGMPQTQTNWIGTKFAQVTDFRTADMQAGGQGAPLAPFYHFALAKRIHATEPLAFLNVGGVGNVTWVDPAKGAPEEPGALVAFDTGPGNALVNDWMQLQTGELLDRDGEAAAEGTVVRARLATNSGKEYLDRRPPKSLDRNDFHGVLQAVAGLSTEDGAATLTYFTADCVAQAQKHMPSPPSRWLVCGGGRHNKTMMRMLAERLDAPVDPVEAIGLDGDMLEAQAFAYLAVRVLRGLPTSAPSTTGCSEPVCGGRIIYPS